MTTAQLEKELLRYTKGLPKETLEEVIDFIQFLRLKRINKSSDNVKTELSLLNYSETTHLEEEFKDYKDLYPCE